jgi:hypothetical protein
MASFIAAGQASAESLNACLAKQVGGILTELQITHLDGRMEAGFSDVSTADRVRTSLRELGVMSFATAKTPPRGAREQVLARALADARRAGASLFLLLVIEAGEREIPSSLNLGAGPFRSVDVRITLEAYNAHDGTGIAETPVKLTRAAVDARAGIGAALDDQLAAVVKATLASVCERGPPAAPSAVAAQGTRPLTAERGAGSVTTFGTLSPIIKDTHGNVTNNYYLGAAPNTVISPPSASK